MCWAHAERELRRIPQQLWQLATCSKVDLPEVQCETALQGLMAMYTHCQKWLDTSQTSHQQTLKTINKIVPMLSGLLLWLQGTPECTGPQGLHLSAQCSAYSLSQQPVLTSLCICRAIMADTTQTGHDIGEKKPA